MWEVEAGEMVREAYTLHKENDDFGQPGTLYREVFDDGQRERSASNASNGVEAHIQDRVVDYWRSVDADLGAQVARGLGR
jgi:catalase